VVDVANCFNFATVELLESRLEKEPYGLATNAKGKIEFKNIYEGRAYKLQSNLRVTDTIFHKKQSCIMSKIVIYSPV
jgi:hypothetical protein